MKFRKPTLERQNDSYWNGWQTALLNQDEYETEAIKQLVALPQDQQHDGYLITNAKENLSRQ